MTDEINKLDRMAMRQAFSNAAKSYDAAAVLQREVAQRMLERFDYIKATPKVVLDIGAGTGEHTASLAKIFPRSRVIGVDVAEPMLQQLKKRSKWLKPLRPVCADMQYLPFADQSVDLIFSSLALQWCESLEETFSEFNRILRPGGFVLFSTFGPDTLKELRQSWAEVDDQVHVHNFMDMHDIGDAMMRSGMAEPVMDVENFTLTYSDVFSLMRELKAIGAHNVEDDRPRGLTGRGRMAALEKAYSQFKQNGVWPASYEVVYGHAWANPNVQQAADMPPQVSIDLLKGHQ